MGTNNKERRAAKKRRDKERRRRAANRGDGRPAETRDHHDGGDRSARVVEIVLHALQIGPDAAIYDAVIDQLDRQPAASQVIDMLWTEQLDALWEHGWTPLDVVHVVSRVGGLDELNEVRRRLVADGQRLDAAGRSLHPRWRQHLNILAEELQLSDGPLGGQRALTSVRVAVGVLHSIASLPGINVVMPPPGDVATRLPEGARIDPRMLTRVRALLSQAESTTFEEEAEAFMAKAQELIARHAIDQALLHTVDDIGEPAIRRLYLDDPYPGEKAQLMGAVASANRCRIVWHTDFGWATAFGYDQDLDAVELIGTSLLAQATSVMLRHGSSVDASGRSRTRSFRRSFILGFAQRIGVRLQQATDEQVAEADGSERFLPVLAARDHRVDNAVKREFPKVSSKRTSISNGAGWVAGQNAADEARLDPTDKRLPLRN